MELRLAVKLISYLKQHTLAWHRARASFPDAHPFTTQ